MYKNISFILFFFFVTSANFFKLIQSTDISYTSETIFSAARKGDVRLIEQIINKKAYMEGDLERALHISIYVGHTDVVRLLIEKKAYPYYIHHYVDYDALKKEEEINTGNRNEKKSCRLPNNTLLHIACKEGHLEIVGLYLERQSDLQLKENIHGHLPIDEAFFLMKNENVNFSQPPENPCKHEEIVRLLLNDFIGRHKNSQEDCFVEAEKHPKSNLFEILNSRFNTTRRRRMIFD